jgi:hypothetical protein
VAVAVEPIASAIATVTGVWRRLQLGALLADVPQALLECGDFAEPLMSAGFRSSSPRARRTTASSTLTSSGVIGTSRSVSSLEGVMCSSGTTAPVVGGV